MTNFEKPILYQTKITGAGLEHLKGMTNLKKLGLHNAPVTDAVVAVLVDMQHVAIQDQLHPRLCFVPQNDQTVHWRVGLLSRFVRNLLVSHYQINSQRGVGRAHAIVAAPKAQQNNRPLRRLW